MLRAYVNRHWSLSAEGFQPPQSVSCKDTVRKTALCLAVDESKLMRSAAAALISAIASFDWPDEWPNLTADLLHLLKVGNELECRGILKVLRGEAPQVYLIDRKSLWTIHSRTINSFWPVKS